MRLVDLSVCVSVCVSVCLSVCLCTRIGGNMHSNERLLVISVVAITVLPIEQFRSSARCCCGLVDLEFADFFID